MLVLTTNWTAASTVGSELLEALLPQVATAVRMNGRELALEWGRGERERGRGGRESTLNPHEGFLWE